MIDDKRFRSPFEDERAHAARLLSSLRADIASAEMRAVACDSVSRTAKGFRPFKKASLLGLQLEHLEEIDAAPARILEGTYASCLNVGVVKFK